MVVFCSNTERWWCQSKVLMWGVAAQLRVHELSKVLSQPVGHHHLTVLEGLLVPYQEWWCPVLHGCHPYSGVGKEGRVRGG